jgi:hypothetical protein
MRTRRKSLLTWGVLAVAVTVLAVAAVVGVQWWRERDRSDLERAVAMAPHDGEQLSWTDWAGVRDELGLDLGDDPDEDQIAEMMDRGFEHDLTQTTALGGSAAAMQARLGYSPATAEWELFSQSSEGAAVMVRLADSDDVASVADHLARAGYDEPDDENGVWTGGREALVTGALTPELSYVLLDEDRGLVLSSDSPGYLATAAKDMRGERGPGSLDDVVGASGDPLVAAIYTGEHACAKLAMSQADPVDQDQASALLAQAGEVDPMTAFALSVRPGGEVRVAMGFETEEQARTNADTRARLAAGPAPGEGGDFSDLFSLGEVAADGTTVTMELDPVENSYAFSSLKDGPVLFATC